METQVNEIADRIYRLSTYIPDMPALDRASTVTVAATSMISSAGRPARAACSRILSWLDAW